MESSAPELCFMYLRAILCTFRISVDFYYLPVGGRRGGRGGLEKGGGLERGGTVSLLTVPLEGGVLAVKAKLNCTRYAFRAQKRLDF